MAKRVHNQFFSDHLTLQECMYWALAHISKCFSCFVLDKCSVNCPRASQPTKESKWVKRYEWISKDVGLRIFWELILRSSVDKVVNFMDNWSIVMCKPSGGWELFAYDLIMSECVWLWLMLTYVVSGADAWSLVLLDGSNTPIIGFISFN